LSAVIASRDAELKEVFRRTAVVSQILAERTGKVQTLIRDGDLLAIELLRQRSAIETLFTQTSALTDQLAGLVAEGRTRLRPALLELRSTLDLVNKNRANLQLILERLGPFIRSLGEAVGSGPFFLAYIGNFTPEGFPTS
jgi:phospholipid/cholesterol/gamma-HCH transport system substrate-binding protein